MTTKPSQCPNCGSAKMAAILYGLPAFNEELQHQLDHGELVLGGCCITDDDPPWECINCGHRWGQRNPLRSILSEMPAPVAEVHGGLVPVVVTVHVRWTLALQLYGSMDRVRLLYRFADVLFNEVKQTLIGDVLLKLSQLTDKATMAKNENLSLHRLCKAVELDEPGLIARLELDSMLRSMETACGNIRGMRNRTIAHRDWGRRAEAASVTNKNEIEDALAIAAKMMNAVEFYYKRSERIYEGPYPVFGDGDGLIDHLQKYAELLDEAEGRRAGPSAT